MEKDIIKMLMDSVQEKAKIDIRNTIRTCLTVKPNYKKINKYKKKYKGASKYAIAQRLIDSACKKAGINGSVSCGVVSASEALSLAKPEAIAVIGASIFEDISATVKIEMQLIVDIAALYGCEYDCDDEEDVWIIFFSAIGLKVEDKLIKIGRYIFNEAGTTNLKNLLRYKGSRAAFQKLVTKYAGKEVAKSFAEKSILKLIPAVNILLGYTLNHFTVRSVGRVAINKAKIRSALNSSIIKIKDNDINLCNYIIYTLKYIVEYFDEQSLIENYALLWRAVIKNIDTDIDEDEIDKFSNSDNFNSMYLELLSKILDENLRSEFYNIAITIAATSNNKNVKHYDECLSNMCSVLNLRYERSDLVKKRNYFDSGVKDNLRNSKFNFKGFRNRKTQKFYLFNKN